MCAEYWPPALAAAGAQPSGDIGLVTLEDGRKQWAYKNMPLYTYVKDKAPGDATGEGAEGEWYVVKRVGWAENWRALFNKYCHPGNCASRANAKRLSRARSPG